VTGASQYQYAVIRLVPRVERGEGFNVAVVLFCRQLEFLAARSMLDRELLARFAPDCEVELVVGRLALLERVASGDPTAGPIARLSQSERYHWLVAPSSTMLQPAPAHTGLTDDPTALLERLFAELVAR
jgi:hypothetical protein